MTISLFTEITETERTGRLFFDAECPICTALAEAVKPSLQKKGVQVSALQETGVAETFGFSPAELMTEMRVITESGRRLGGMDAILYLLALFPLAKPMVWVAHLPGLYPLLIRAYRWFAAHRPCGSGVCKIHPRTLQPWAGLVFLLPLGTWLGCVHFQIHPWVQMWLLAGSIWVALKAFSYWQATRRLGFENTWRLAPFLLWPGVDAETFFQKRNAEAPLPRIGEAVTAILLGVVALGGTMAAAPGFPYLAGLLGMGAFLAIAHFGVFPIICRALQQRGYAAVPLMDRPWLADSLQDFWGRRWNTGFSLPARRYLFLPLAKRLGGGRALFLVFAASGLLHEWVLAVPVLSGLGGPLLYFLVQGVGVFLERKLAKFTPGLSPGWRRTFTLLVVVVPAPLLFHPGFAIGVILPWLQTCLGGLL